MKKRLMLAVVSVLLILCFVAPCLADSAEDEEYWDWYRSALDMWTDNKGDNYASWKNNGKNVDFRIKMENMSKGLTVDSFSFAIYCTDEYGDVICTEDPDDGDVMYFTCTKKFKPGKVGYSDYFRLAGFRGAKKVYAALAAFHVKDGETIVFGESTEKDMLKQYSYVCWELK